jgi:catechol 2,3-dioxygenase-like lactoylglutathione lyase family enzyme
MNPYICQIAFSVSVLDRSVPFYRDVLGLEDSGGIRFRGPNCDYVQGIQGIQGIDSKAYWLQNGRRKFQLEFFQFLYPPAHPIPANRNSCDIGLTRVAFDVEDIRETLAAAQRCCASAIAGPSLIKGRKHAVLKDPDGITVELIEAPQRLSSGRKSRVAGVAMSVRDLEKAVKQYTDGFMQKLSQEPFAVIDPLLDIEGAKRRVSVIEGEYVWLELSQYDTPKPKPRREGHLLTDIGISHIAFCADTLSDFKRMYTKLVVENWLKPHNPIPKYVGKLAAAMYGRDNDGFTIETCYLSNTAQGMFGFKPPKTLDRLGQRFFETVWGMQYKSHKA